MLRPSSTAHEVFQSQRSDPAAILASLVNQLSTPWLGSPLLEPAVKVCRDREAKGSTSGSLRIEESYELSIKLSTY